MSTLMGGVTPGIKLSVYLTVTVRVLNDFIGFFCFCYLNLVKSQNKFMKDNFWTRIEIGFLQVYAFSYQLYKSNTLSLSPVNLMIIFFLLRRWKRNKKNGHQKHHIFGEHWRIYQPKFCTKIILLWWRNTGLKMMKQQRPKNGWRKYSEKG